jgi:putative FmdB family regulatory protein
MPTYAYQCKVCKNEQDEIHCINEKIDVKCQKCGSECVKIFAPTRYFVLKGGGWPSQDMKMKSQMTEKNTRMKRKMRDREAAGEGVRRVQDLAKI